MFFTIMRCSAVSLVVVHLLLHVSPRARNPPLAVAAGEREELVGLLLRFSWGSLDQQRGRGKVFYYIPSD
jgi:hypothetical protein